MEVIGLIKKTMVISIFWAFIFSNMTYAILMTSCFPTIIFFIEALRTNGFQNFGEVI